VLAAEQPQRLAALVPSGQWLHHPPHRTGVAELAAYVRQSGDPGAIVREVCDAEGIPSSHWIRSVDHGDGEVVAALLEGWLTYDWEGRAAPHQLPVPILMIVGELEDPDREAGRRRGDADASAVTMPGVGHIGVQLAVDESVAHARPFLTRFTSSQRI